MNQQRIGQFIKDLRKEKELTQQDLADMLGVTNRAVSKWENGLSLPDYSILNDLCEILDISINELLSGEKLDKKDYQKKFEENVFNSISYKIKKNNKKVTIIILYIILFVVIFAFSTYKAFNYSIYDIKENIQYRNSFVKNVELIFKDIEKNDLANKVVMNENLSIYIPDGFKEHTDLKETSLIQSGCDTFIKNYKSKYENDGYIQICRKEVLYPLDDSEESIINYLEKKKLYDSYDYINYYYNMKNVNIFSCLNDIKAFNYLTNRYGNVPDEQTKIYMLKSKEIKSSIYATNIDNTSSSERTYYGAYITEKGIPTNHLALHYSDQEYILHIEDATNSISIDDVIKIIESIKVRGETGFAKFLRE